MLSFIVPIYNTREYLPRCVDSLMHCGLSDYEIILVDDGSTDGSDVLCRQYQNRYPDRIRWIAKENGGVSSARNAGLEAAKGTDIMFVDSDDYLLEGLGDAKLGQDFDIMIFKYTQSDVPKKLDGAQRTCEIDYVKAAELILGRKAVPHVHYITPWGKIYRKRIIDQNHLKFHEELSIGEDMLFNLSYFMKCRLCVTVNRELYHSEERSGSASRRFDTRKRENDRIFNGQLKRMIMETPQLRGCESLYWDNVVYSVGRAFVSIFKYFDRKEQKAAMNYIEALEQESLEQEGLRRCTFYVNPVYQIIYWCLLHKKGKALYRLLHLLIPSFVLKKWRKG